MDLQANIIPKITNQNQLVLKRWHIINFKLYFNVQFKKRVIQKASYSKGIPEWFTKPIWF